MSNVIELKQLGALIVQVKSLSVLENIESNFVVFSRADLNNEIILDCTFIDDDEGSAKELCDILGIDVNSEQAREITSSGYVVFYT